MATDKAGVITWKAVAESFGSTEPIENTMQMNLRFPGQYWDQEINAGYNMHRNYDSKIGRFIQQDFLGLNDGANYYSYGQNNALRYLDDDGFKSKDPVLIDMGKKIKAFIDKICKQKDESCQDYYKRVYKTCTGMLIGGGIACGPLLAEVPAACATGEIPECPELISCNSDAQGDSA